MLLEVIKAWAELKVLNSFDFFSLESVHVLEEKTKPQINLKKIKKTYYIIYVPLCVILTSKNNHP